jgi:hypothetical protein
MHPVALVEEPANDNSGVNVLKLFSFVTDDEAQ